MRVLQRALVSCAFLGAPSAILAGQLDKAECTYKSIPLHGKVKIVSAFPDIKVRVVNAFADLSVKKVNAFANKCGEWQIVDSFPDFTIQLVDAFGDITINWTDSFPGVR